VLSYLRSEGKLKSDDERRLPALIEFLRELGANGTMRRTHVLVAKKK
jgi:hypothetical protein